MEYILRRALDGERESVVDVTVDGARALLVFADRLEAGEYAAHWTSPRHTPTAVPPAEISETCARHGLALVALRGYTEPESVDVVSVEALPLIFG